MGPVLGIWEAMNCVTQSDICWFTAVCPGITWSKLTHCCSASRQKILSLSAACCYWRAIQSMAPGGGGAGALLAFSTMYHSPWGSSIILHALLGVWGQGTKLPHHTFPKMV